jgi:hypothetical protein
MILTVNGLYFKGYNESNVQQIFSQSEAYLKEKNIKGVYEINESNLVII